jgi:protein ImuA
LRSAKPLQSLKKSPAPALAAAESQALAERSLAGEGGEPALPFSRGIPAPDEAMDATRQWPRRGSNALLRNAGANSGFLPAPATVPYRHDDDSKSAFSVNSPDFRRHLLDGGGSPEAVGIRDFGLRPEQSMHASPRKQVDALWLAEAAIEKRCISSN